MNDLFVNLYEPFFDYELYASFLDIIFNAGGYQLFGFALIFTPIVTFIAFYKIWDPVNKQKLFWFLTVILNSVLLFVLTSSLIYGFQEMQEYIGNYTGEADQLNPDSFILTMGLLSAGIMLVFSFIFSLGIRLVSTSNRHNPF